MRQRRIALTASLLVIGLSLGGCESLPGMDWFSTKKPLPGERKAVFPEGVPGVPQGVPQELVQGAAPQPEPLPQVVEEKPKPKPKPRPRPQQAAAPAPSPARTTAPQQQTSSPAAWPEPQQSASQPARGPAPFPDPPQR